MPSIDLLKTGAQTERTMRAPPYVSIATIAEISPGVPVVAGSGPNTVAVAFPRDVAASGLPTQEALERAYPAEGARRDRAVLRVGDVVVVARGSSPRAAEVGNHAAGAIASANLLIVRLRTDLLLPSVLVAFFQTPEGQRSLVAAQTGGATPLITVAALGKLEVPIPPMHVQQSLGKFVMAAGDLLDAEAQALAARRGLIMRITELVLAGHDLSGLAGTVLL